MVKPTEIKEETKLGEILENPRATEVLMRYGLPCLSCPFAAIEMDDLTLGVVTKRYDLPLTEILRDLNEGL
jgi:hypothetical protein